MAEADEAAEWWLHGRYVVPRGAPTFILDFGDLSEPRATFMSYRDGMNLVWWPQALRPGAHPR